ncbi:MAG: TolC family protein, partial [Cloacibacillus sp.]
QEQLLAAYEQTVLGAVGEVRNALSANVQEYQRNESLRLGKEAAQVALDVANDKYANGLVDFTNVISAQTALTLLSEEYAVSQGQISSNAVQLFKALGGGWRPMEEAEKALSEAAKLSKKK